MNKQPASIRVVTALLILAVVLACNLSVPSSDNGLSATKAVLDRQMTEIAAQQAENLRTTQAAMDAKSTQLAEQEAKLAQAATAAAVQPPTSTPFPSPTQAPTGTATAIPTPELTQAAPLSSPTAALASGTADLESKLKGAKILLYEDIAGYYDLTRWVREALNDGGYSYIDVGDAVGDFKSELLSGTKWDLIIASSEARKSIEGEFYTYLVDAANKGAAVIIETYYLDQNATAPLRPLMQECGIAFQKNWMNPDKNSRSVIWLNPDHPLFHEPNKGFSLVHNATYWEGDAGDMMMKRSTGEGELLAGIYSWEKSRYGVIASCKEGRVILLTVSTHDYRKSDMIPLWQNFVHFTLKNHFEKQSQ